ncbi:MAG TPA: ZIP family metal transporter [Puia sp.]|nr:ZIP family metal transporter [Puia sp.]
MVILLTGLTFISTLAGGMLALCFKDKLHLILGFSAGAVLGVCFFDLLPESLSLGKGLYSERFLIGIIALGFVIYLILDRLASLHFHARRIRREGRWNVAAGSLSVHSFFDGVAIGVGFQVSRSTGLFVALAVIAHCLADGLNTVGVVLKNGGTAAKGVKWLLIDSFAPVMGVISTYFFNIPREVFALMLSLFTGFFLFIGASDLLPGSLRTNSFWTTAMTLIGISAIAAAITVLT